MLMSMPCTRFARWCICISKIPFGAYFGGPLNWKCCYVFLSIWYILWQFRIFCVFFQFWLFIPRKIWLPCLVQVHACKTAEIGITISATTMDEISPFGQFLVLGNFLRKKSPKFQINKH
jgi:hypothetical protein